MDRAIQLSWKETYRAIAAEQGTWSDFEGTILDGLDNDEFDSGALSTMDTTLTKPMTFEEFLAWDDGSGRDYELRDGFPMPIVDPNAKHEDVADELCEMLSSHCKDLSLPYVPKRQKQVMTGNNLVTGREESRRADIVVFDKGEWE